MKKPFRSLFGGRPAFGGFLAGVALGGAAFAGAPAWLRSRDQAALPRQPGAAARARSAAVLPRVRTAALAGTRRTQQLDQKGLERLFRRLTLHQKIGQMLMFAFHGTSVNRKTQRLIDGYALGGLVLFRRNMVSRSQMHSLTTRLQRAAMDRTGGVGLFLAVDQEGGAVSQLPPGLAGRSPSAARLGRSGIEATRREARRTAEVFRSAGLNMNLAPCLDVLTVPSNPVLPGRTFGRTPDRVAAHGCEYVRTLQEGGIIATAKHFPGHGATASDSHKLLPRVSLPFRKWEEEHLYPFRMAIAEAGLDAVMTGHIAYRFAGAGGPVDGGRPATLSPYFITRVLRRHLDFQGVIVTDSLNMAAVSKRYPWPQAVRNAVLAGADVLLIPEDPDRHMVAWETLRDSAERDPRFRARIDESVRRILRLKLKYGLLYAES